MPTGTAIEAPNGQAPPEWLRVAATIDGVPVWRRRDERCYVATRDMDQLRFLGAALAWFDQMSGPELRAFMTSHRPRTPSSNGIYQLDRTR